MNKDDTNTSDSSVGTVNCNVGNINTSTASYCVWAYVWAVLLGLRGSSRLCFYPSGSIKTLFRS